MLNKRYIKLNSSHTKQIKQILIQIILLSRGKNETVGVCSYYRNSHKPQKYVPLQYLLSLQLTHLPSQNLYSFMFF